MYILVSEKAIVQFLLKYNIDYFSLTFDTQAIICVCANILFLIFWSVVFYILYRLFVRILDRWF